MLQTEDCVEAHTNVDVVVDIEAFKELLQSRLPLVFQGASVQDAALPWPEARELQSFRDSSPDLGGIYDTESELQTLHESGIPSQSCGSEGKGSVCSAGETVSHRPLCDSDEAGSFCLEEQADQTPEGVSEGAWSSSHRQQPRRGDGSLHY